MKDANVGSGIPNPPVPTPVRSEMDIPKVVPTKNDAMVPTTPQPKEPPFTPSSSVVSQEPSEVASEMPADDAEHLTRKVASAMFVREPQVDPSNLNSRGPKLDNITCMIHVHALY